MIVRVDDFRSRQVDAQHLGDERTSRGVDEVRDGGDSFGGRIQRGFADVHHHTRRDVVRSPRCGGVATRRIDAPFCGQHRGRTFRLAGRERNSPVHSYGRGPHLSDPGAIIDP